MRIKERIAAEKKAAQALIAKGEDNLTDEEFDELKAHVAEAKKLEERAKLMQDAAGVLDDGAQGEPATVKKAAKDLGEHMFAELASKGMSLVEAKNAGFETTEFKAASDANATGGAAGANAPYLTELDGAVFEPRRELKIVDLMAKGTMSGQIIKYPVYGKLEGGPSATAEGTQSPHSHFPDPTWKSDTLHSTTVLFEITDDMIDDMPYVASEIKDHNDYEMDVAREDDVWNGDGTGQNIEGVLHRIPADSEIKDSDKSPLEDRIFHATTMIKDNTGFTADGLVINSVDYEALRLKRDKNGQYYGGGYFLPPYGGNGTMYIAMTPWGLPTVVTKSQEQGTCVVGAFKQSAKFLTRGTRTLKVSDSHKDNFGAGITAFRIKERNTIQVKYPYGFVKIATAETGVASEASLVDGTPVAADESEVSTQEAKTVKGAKAAK